MSDHTIRTIDALPSVHHGAVKLAGADLGVESFGLQILDFPPGFAGYPEHDHSADGQEEVYVLLRGSAAFVIDAVRADLLAGQIIRIGPRATRSLMPGPDGVRILAIGCAPDRPYERPRHFRLEAGS